jgi:aminoglycoside phosphotransferase (APT) family kinase protein
VLGANRIYRVWTEEGSRILKLYGTPARERRERHALEAVAGIEGTPTMLDGGVEGETAWIMFDDGGQWSIESLPENVTTGRRVGEILARIHEVDTALVSNLARGIDQDWIIVDFASTFRRLERYRAKIGLSADLIERGRSVRPPYASQPRVSHTNTVPENFLVDEAGNVTLINWEWATLAPIEWDISKASWLIGVRSGPAAANAVQTGYGKALDPHQMDRWIVYHSSMMLVQEAENTMRTDLSEFQWLTAELQRAIAGAQTIT